jgi:hypothetical protein
LLICSEGAFTREMAANELIPSSLACAQKQRSVDKEVDKTISCFAQVARYLLRKWISSPSGFP